MGILREPGDEQGGGWDEDSVMRRLGIRRRAKVLLLGTFHFDYPGLDAHVPSEKIDILSGARQAEVAEVVDLLCEFCPTGVAVERRPEKEDDLNREYRAYREGAFVLPRSEVYQLGFRIAARCGHEGLHAVDAWGREYDSWQDIAIHCADLLGVCSEGLTDEQLQELYFRVLSGGRMEAFNQLLNERDARLRCETLREYLLHENSPEAVRLGHGIYLSWLDGQGGDYTLVDQVSGWWYNRNLRIFANLKRISEAGDRILVIFGSGHLPILRHALEHSWDFQLVEPAVYLLR